jgi:hypothetical protein
MGRGKNTGFTITTTQLPLSLQFDEITHSYLDKLPCVSNMYSFIDWFSLGYCLVEIYFRLDDQSIISLKNIEQKIYHLGNKSALQLYRKIDLMERKAKYKNTIRICN